MPSIIEQDAPPTATRHSARQFHADEIARDLALMDELEAFAQSLPPRAEGRSLTAQELREIAYETREANLL